MVAGKPVEHAQASQVHRAGVLYRSEIQRADVLEVAWRGIPDYDTLHTQTSDI